METITRDLEALTSFYWVAKMGSFTQAAERLATSKAMVSKQVSRLETALKSQLFRRTTRTVTLTEEGEALLRYSQKIFDLSAQAEQQIQEISNGLSGVIKISTPVSFGSVFFQSFLPEISKVLPNVKFEADLSNENRNFEKDRIDFAIRAVEVEEPDVVARYVGHLRDVICVTPKKEKQLKITRDPESLASQDCIVYSHEHEWNQWNLKSKDKDLSVKVTGRYAVNQYIASKAFCLNDFGIARLPYYEVMDELRSGKLVQLFKSYQIATHPLYLVYNKGEYETKKHRIVKEALLKWFKDRKEIFASQS